MLSHFTTSPRVMRARHPVHRMGGHGREDSIARRVTAGRRDAGRPSECGCPSRIRTSANGSKVRCPTTRRRGRESGYRVSAPGEEWSGRRDSNPRPSPWQGDALPTEPLPLDDRPDYGAESQIRTGDTAIFSRVLYQLSYLGPVPGPRGGPSARRRIARFRRGRQPHSALAAALQAPMREPDGARATLHGTGATTRVAGQGGRRRHHRRHQRACCRARSRPPRNPPRSWSRTSSPAARSAGRPLLPPPSARSG